MKARALIVLGLIFAVGCSKATPTSASGVQSIWKDAGLEPTEFKDVTEDKLDATTCQRGKVSGIEVTVCVYADKAAAKDKREAGLTLVGNHTGASLAHGTLLLVVVDRDNIDPSGRTIQRITKTFRKS